jgi:hypothetical protein
MSNARNPPPITSNPHAETGSSGGQVLISPIIHGEKKSFSRRVLAPFANLALVKGGNFALRVTEERRDELD